MFGVVANFKSAIGIGVGEAEFVVEHEVAIEYADDQVREWAAGFCFFDDSKDEKTVRIGFRVCGRHGITRWELDGSAVPRVRQAADVRMRSGH